MLIKKLSSIEDRDQTDHVTALPRPYTQAIDIDLWHWPLTLTYEPDFQSKASYGQDTHTHTQKLKFTGRSVQKIEWKQTGRQTDATDCLPSQLTLTVTAYLPPMQMT